MTDEHKSDEQEFQEAYLVTCENDLKTVIGSVDKAEKEYDKAINIMLKAKKALGLCYFLRDKVTKKLNEAKDDLARFNTQQDDGN